MKKNVNLKCCFSDWPLVLISAVVFLLWPLFVCPAQNSTPAVSTSSNQSIHKKNGGIASFLNLTEKQQALLTAMHNKRRVFSMKICPDPSKGCPRNREQMRATLLFKAEVLAEKPDFQAVAKKLKSEYHGEYKSEFRAFVDAQAAFLSSLNADQREAMMTRPRKFRPAYKGGGHGMSGGKFIYKKGPEGAGSGPPTQGK